jgi:hypothetical protein
MTDEIKVGDRVSNDSESGGGEVIAIHKNHAWVEGRFDGELCMLTYPLYVLRVVELPQ